MIDFWASQRGRAADLERLSTKQDGTDFFVSHCWGQPDDWSESFSSNLRFNAYAFKKAQELKFG